MSRQKKKILQHIEDQIDNILESISLCNLNNLIKVIFK